MAGKSMERGLFVFLVGEEELGSFTHVSLHLLYHSVLVLSCDSPAALYALCCLFPHILCFLTWFQGEECSCFSSLAEAGAAPIQDKILSALVHSSSI